MKKIKVILFLFFLFFPMFVFADTVNYKIQHFYVNADILEDGDMEVTELFVLKGSFNGYVRDLMYENTNPELGTSGYENNRIYNATGIQMEEISAKEIDSVSFDTLFQDDFTKLTKGLGANLGYTEGTILGGKSYKMYFKSSKKAVAFRLKYKVQDAVVLHNDVGELYYTFIGDDFLDRLNDVQIKVNLPKKDTSNQFLVWAHGDVAGTIFPYEQTYALAKIQTLDKKSLVDVRITFSSSLMDKTLVKKTTDEDALEGIIAVETKRAEDANKKRKKMKILFYTILGLSISQLLLLLFLWLRTYFKYDKEYKATFSHKYNREFIDDYNVEVVDYLMNKNITPNALSASIMNLIYKKVIKVEELPTDKKKKEYTFTLQEEKQTDCTETEQYLLDFLFKTIGKENQFTSIELQNYAKSTKTCDDFANHYTNWKNKVLSDGKKQNFFEDAWQPRVISISLLALSLILCCMSIIIQTLQPLTIITMIINIFFVIYTFAFFKRTKKGNEDYHKWLAFKRFLEDFGTFETKELPEIVLWERYMVYATVFNLASQVAKVMNVKIKEMQTSGVYNGEHFPTFTDYYFIYDVHRVFTNSIESNLSAITAARANSISSSGSGFGGGFSSGGGFGGGGGGGHGF